MKGQTSAIVVLTVLLIGLISFLYVNHETGFKAVTSNTVYVASCTNPTNGMSVTTSTDFCSGTFNLPNGISIGASNILVTCDSTIINGTKKGVGITIGDLNNITVNKCQIYNYKIGMLANRTSHIIFKHGAVVNSTKYAVYIINSSANSVINSTIIVKNGTTVNGIRIQNNSTSISILNSTIQALGDVPLSGPTKIGIFITSQVSNISITHNLIIMSGTGSGTGSGIKLSDNSTAVLIINNTLHTNASIVISGVELTRSSDNKIVGNTIIPSSSTITGINVGSSSNNNLIKNNTIKVVKLTAPQAGIKIGATVGNNITRNAILVNSTNSFEGVRFTTSNNTIFTDNIVTVIGTGSAVNGLVLTTRAKNSIVKNNNVSVRDTAGGSSRGILVSSANNNTIRNNSIRVRAGTGDIQLFGSGNNSLIDNNFLPDGTPDIVSQSDRNNTLLLTRGQNKLIFYRRFIDVDNITNLFVNTSIVGVNSSLEPDMNTSANVTLAVSSCPSNIKFNTKFTRNASKVLADGQSCNSTTTPACTSISCSGTSLSFNAPHFSSYAGIPTCTIPTNGMNITSSVTFCPGTYNIPNGITASSSNIIIGCDDTVLLGDNTIIADGITAISENNISIRGCTIANYTNDGVRVVFTNNTIIENNNISNVISGIDQDGGMNNTIFNNTISNIQADGDGIFLNNAKSNSIIANDIFNASSTGIQLFSSSNNNTIESNVVENEIHNPFLHAIWIEKSSNNLILNNKILDIGAATPGIEIDCFSGISSDNNLVLNNTISGGNSSGILVKGFVSTICKDNKIVNNTISNISNNGIQIGPLVKNTVISTNNIFNNSMGGILIQNTHNNTISNNMISNNTQGITINSSANNTISNNYLEDNGIDIDAVDASNNTLVVSNGQNRLIFKNKIINVIDIDGLFINDSIVAVNSSAEPAMNTSANISIVVANCPSNITFSTKFTKNASEVLDSGHLCNATTIPACTGIVCSNNVLNFTVEHFSTYAAGNPVVSSIISANSNPRAGASWPMFHRDLNHSGAIGTQSVSGDHFVQIANFSTGGAADSSPAYANGIIYIASHAGKIFELNASNLHQIANFTIGVSGPTIFSPSPVISNGVVYIGSKSPDALFAINASNLVQLRNFSANNDIEGQVPAIATNGIIYTQSGNGLLYALNESNLVHIANTSASAFGLSPAVFNGLVYTSADKVYAFNASNLAQIANFTVAGDSFFDSSPAISNGMVYIGSDDGLIYLLSATDLTHISNVTLGIINMAPTVVNSIVYIGTNDGSGRFFALNASTLAQIANSTIDSSFFDSAPAVYRGVIYLGDGVKHVFALNASTLVQIANFTTGGIVDSSPAVINGTVYIGSNDGNVYALRLEPSAVPTPSGGGGGAPAEVIPPPSHHFAPCAGNFTACTDWSSCANGMQTRICKDTMRCYTPKTESRVCAVQPVIEAPTGVVTAPPAQQEKPVAKSNVFAGLLMALILLSVVIILVGVERMLSITKLRRSYDALATKHIIEKSKTALIKDKKMAVHLYNDAVLAYRALPEEKKKLFEDEMKELHRILMK